MLGKKIEFTYLKDKKVGLINGTLVSDYVANAETYVGTVTGVRDLATHPVSSQTLRYGNIKGDRSQYLYTVELEDGTAKAFYDGRMAAVKDAGVGLLGRIKAAFKS